MHLILAAVLEDDGLARVRAALAGVAWRDGAATAGARARAVKRNLQADLSGRDGAAIAAFLGARLQAHAVFAAAARPRRISPLLISKTQAGGGYGPHVDDAIMAGGGRPLRSDLSFTLFLSDPDAYAGGELVVDGPLGAQAVKPAAGDALLYPSGAIHEVRAVTAGERLVCVGWVESMVRDAGAREILWDLETARAGLPAGSPAGLPLDKAIANLLRRWAQP